MESINFLSSISFCLQIFLFFYVCSLLWSIGTESCATCLSIFYYLLEQNACTPVTLEAMHGKVAPSGSTKTALMNTHYVLSLCILPSIISQQDNINTTCVTVAFVCQKIPLATRLNTKKQLSVPIAFAVYLVSVRYTLLAYAVVVTIRLIPETGKT